MMQKVLLKYAYNDLRANKEKTDFFDKEILAFLMNQENNQAKENIVVMAGIAVNTSPVPDYFFGNQKLQWLRNPLMFENSIITNLDYNTGEMTIREPFEFHLCV